jgi:hypothetical protein
MTKIEDNAAEIVDDLTALVGVTDEGLRGTQERLGRIADGVDRLHAVVPDIGQAIAALAVALAPIEGRPGRDGVNGKDGPIGVDGKQGPPGKPGRDGVDGVDGMVGPLGPPGKAGASGKAGGVGPPGPRPTRSVIETHDQAGRIEFIRQYLDNGASRRLVARRDAVGRLTELVET